MLDAGVHPPNRVPLVLHCSSIFLDLSRPVTEDLPYLIFAVVISLSFLPTGRGSTDRPTRRDLRRLVGPLELLRDLDSFDLRPQIWILGRVLKKAICLPSKMLPFYSKTTCCNGRFF